MRRTDVCAKCGGRLPGAAVGRTVSPQPRGPSPNAGGTRTVRAFLFFVLGLLGAVAFPAPGAAQQGVSVDRRCGFDLAVLRAHWPSAAALDVECFGDEIRVEVRSGGQRSVRVVPRGGRSPEASRHAQQSVLLLAMALLGRLGQGPEEVAPQTPVPPNPIPPNPIPELSPRPQESLTPGDEPSPPERSGGSAHQLGDPNEEPSDGTGAPLGSPASADPEIATDTPAMGLEAPPVRPEPEASVAPEDEVGEASRGVGTWVPQAFFRAREPSARGFLGGGLRLRAGVAVGRRRRVSLGGEVELFAGRATPLPAEGVATWTAVGGSAALRGALELHVLRGAVPVSLVLGAGVFWDVVGGLGADGLVVQNVGVDARLGLEVAPCLGRWAFLVGAEVGVGTPALRGVGREGRFVDAGPVFVGASLGSRRCAQR